MAQVKNNLVIQGLSGSLGKQIVIRKGKGGRTIVAARPTFGAERVFNPVQLLHQEAFRQAIAYAKTARTQEVYINKAQGTPKSAFNVAVADWFKKPEVLEIDINGWTGLAGQTLRVKAQDDTLVTKVHVVVTDENNTVLEEGDAVQADGLWWNYTTQTGAAGALNPRISATVQDLPGNSHVLTWSWN